MLILGNKFQGSPHAPYFQCTAKKLYLVPTVKHATHTDSILAFKIIFKSNLGGFMGFFLLISLLKNENYRVSSSPKHEYKR